MTSGEIEDINEVRALLAGFFKQENMNKTVDSLWSHTEKLIFKKFIKYSPPERWEEMFKKEHKKMYENELKLLIRPNRQAKSKADLSNLFQITNNFYLNPINAPRLQNEPDFNDENVIQRLVQYNQFYQGWKKKKIQEFEQNIKLIDTKTTSLVCGQCGV